jgi:hypothetical protein
MRSLTNVTIFISFLIDRSVYDFTEWSKIGNHPGGPDKITMWNNTGELHAVVFIFITFLLHNIFISSLMCANFYFV